MPEAAGLRPVRQESYFYMMWTLLKTIYDRNGVSEPLHRTWQPIIRTKGLSHLGCLAEPDIGAELRIAFQTSFPQLIHNSGYRNCTSDARELPANAAFAQHVQCHLPRP